MGKNKILIVLLIIVIIVSFVIAVINFRNIKNDKSYKNGYYNEETNKINEADFQIGKIKFNITMDEVKNILGEPIEVSEFVDSENSENSYKRYDYENLIIQFDYEKEKVNYIASSKKDLENVRGISCGDTVTDVLKKYYSEKNIDVYENTYGSYEILYGKDDAINYINELNSENKTFGYIYKYNNEINSIIFCENGKVVEFYFDNNIVNMIIVAKVYKPW